MPDDRLVERIDQTLRGTPSDWRLLLAQSYRDELVRREHERSTQAMLGYTQQMRDLTRQIRNFTVVILVATLVALALGAWQ